jgi:hypothetical protein
MKSLDARYLLVITCSQRKNESPGLLPAIDRYDGINYRIIRKAMRDGYLPKNLDILIISAKYGLLEQKSLIENYDQLMTKERAKELRNSISSLLAERIKLTKYNEIFLNIGKTYKMALEGWDAGIGSDSLIVYANGGIGKKSSQMLHWLKVKKD